MVRWGAQILITVVIVMVLIFAVKKVAINYDVPVLRTVAEGI